MANEAEIVANDLKIYFSGLEVALHQGKVDDAIRYIGNIKSELDDNLSYPQSKRGGRKSRKAAQQDFKKRPDRSTYTPPKEYSLHCSYRRCCRRQSAAGFLPATE